MNATDELQNWLYEHKSHSARITHDDGYGAGAGWEVELWFTANGEQKKITSH